MIKKCTAILLISFFIFLFIDGCVTTERITRRSELNNYKTGIITVVMRDQTRYVLYEYSLSDSSLIGTGSLTKDGGLTSFHGSILLSDIHYIQTNSVNYMKALLVAGVSAFFVANFIAMLNDSPVPSLQTTTITERYYLPDPTGSCPFIYSWDGVKYTREGEAFGIGFGKGLELTTCTILRSLKECDNELKVRITNERPETHFFNSVQLRAVETDTNALVFADCNNKLWQVYHPIEPISATDNSIKSVLNKISSHDNNFWESDLAQTSSNPKYEDVVDLSFPNPKRKKNGSLIIHAINTYLGYAIFQKTFEFLGDEAADFMIDVERDPELIANVRDWMTKAAIKVAVWNRNTWEKVGIVNLEEDVIPFAKLVRINTADTTSDSIKVRLTCLTDSWKIDAVQMDWSDAEPLRDVPLEIVRATSADNESIIPQLRAIDDSYYIMLPPDKMDLTFRPLKCLPGKKFQYALNACGYLHEWFPAPKENSQMMAVNFISSGSKSDYIKNLIKHEDIFLPLIYSEWFKMKKQGEYPR